MLTLHNDIRYPFRLILKNRLSSLFMALVLAVGIGANTAVFSMVDAIVRRPFPFHDIDRVVTLAETLPKAGAQRYGVSAGNFIDWKNESRVLERAAAYKESAAILIGPAAKEPVDVCLVSPEFFQILGLTPYAGRYFPEREDDAERNTVVVSYRFWQRRLGADPLIVGKKVNLDGLDYDVMGIAPASLDFPLYTEVWMPLVFSPANKTDRSRRDLTVIAKVKAPHSVSEAGSELTRISAQLAERYPATNKDSGVAVVPLIESVNSYSRSFVLMLMGAVGFVLLLACANVANLQLTRIIMRRKELALRFALGAHRMQIIRQLFIEGLILSLLGAGPGIMVALAMLAYIKQNVTQAVVRNVAGFSNVGLDARVLAFTLVASVVSAVLFVLPAIYQALQGRVFEVLKEEGRSASPGKGGRRIRSVLVITEVMMAIILLVGASLMINAFDRITNADRGYSPLGISVFSLDLSSSRYADQARVKDLYKRVLEQVGNTSGVQSAGMVSVLPSVGDSQSSQVATEDSGPNPVGAAPSVEVRIVSEAYFKTMSIPLKAGRGFTVQDNADGQPVAIVSESAARAFWPGRPPLGRRVKLLSSGFEMPWLNIIGVTEDVNYFFLNAEVRPTIYLSYQQIPVRSMSIVVHTNPRSSGTGAVLRNAVQQVDATQEVYRITSMQALLADMAGGVKILAALMMVLGLLALVLCASGVYAIISYSVAQQTHEIAIRMALGAQKGDVLRLVFRYAIKLVAIGLSFGTPVAIALGHVLSHALEGVVVVPVLSFVWLAMLMLFVGVLASYAPARRAIRVSPITAMRY
jgi:putative ABC transport system permease protein